MSKLVRIQSSTTIHVTCGVNALDATNPAANLPDRLQVAASFTKNIVLIKEGTGMYPAEIAEWNTVKALARDGVLTIGETVEATAPEDIEKCETFARNQKAVEAATTHKATGKKAASKGGTLAEASED